MQKSIDMYVDLTESVFKVIVWTSIIAVFTASLKLQYNEGNHQVIFAAVPVMLILLGMTYTYSFIKIVLPACNIFFPSAKYIKAMETLVSMKNTSMRMNALLKMFKMKENFLVVLFLFIMLMGMKNLFEVLLNNYVSNL